MRLSAPPALDGLWAASLLLWAALGVRSSAAFGPVQGAVVVLHLLVAVLFVLRSPARAPLSVASVSAALPSLALVLLAVAHAPHPASWTPALQALFVAGALLTVASFGFLGRAFGVLPALRGVVARGPYRWIRHPGYLGECLMVAALCVAIGGALGLVLGIGAVAAFAVRIAAEESVLVRSRRYVAYQRRVAYRLVPLLW